MSRAEKNVKNARKSVPICLTHSLKPRHEFSAETSHSTVKELRCTTPPPTRNSDARQAGEKRPSERYGQCIKQGRLVIFTFLLASSATPVAGGPKRPTSAATTSKKAMRKPPPKVQKETHLCDEGFLSRYALLLPPCATLVRRRDASKRVHFCLTRCCFAHAMDAKLFQNRRKLTTKWGPAGMGADGCAASANSVTKSSKLCSNMYALLSSRGSR